MQFNEAVAARIFELCNKKNITPNKLAELSGISSSTLQGIIQEKVINPSSYLIFLISNTLDITISEFFESTLFNNKKIIRYPLK